jgi:hypothetical protein
LSTFRPPGFLDHGEDVAARRDEKAYIEFGKILVGLPLRIVHGFGDRDMQDSIAAKKREEALAPGSLLWNQPGCCRLQRRGGERRRWQSMPFCNQGGELLGVDQAQLLQDRGEAILQRTFGPELLGARELFFRDQVFSQERTADPEGIA